MAILKFQKAVFKYQLISNQINLFVVLLFGMELPSIIFLQNKKQKRPNVIVLLTDN